MRKFVLLGLLAAMFMAVLPYSNATAQIPRILNYQASLIDQDGKPLNGNLTMTFAIFDDETDGVIPLWAETLTVTAVSGFVNVWLGETNALNLPFDKPYWLEIKVQDGTPYARTRLTTSPYTMHSLTAIKADTADIATTVIDGAITQRKLADDVSAYPWGPAGGALSGNYPNPVISKTYMTNVLDSQYIRRYEVALGDLDGIYPFPTIRIGAVRTNRIADLAVTTEKLANGAVTQPKLADDAVNPNKVDAIDPITGVNALDGQAIMIDPSTNQPTWGYAWPGGPAGGDLYGTYPDPQVQGIHGRYISPIEPTVGQVYMWDNTSQWMPTTANGDIAGAYNYLQIQPNTVGIPELWATKDGSVTEKPVDITDNGRLLFYKFGATPEKMTWSSAPPTIETPDRFMPMWDVPSQSYVWDYMHVHTVDPIIGDGSSTFGIQISPANDDEMLYYDIDALKWVKGKVTPNNLLTVNPTPLGSLENGHVLTWNNGLNKMQWRESEVYTIGPIVGSGTSLDPVKINNSASFVNDWEVLYYDQSANEWTAGLVTPQHMYAFPTTPASPEHGYSLKWNDVNHSMTWTYPAFTSLPAIGNGTLENPVTLDMDWDYLWTGSHSFTGGLYAIDAWIDNAYVSNTFWAKRATINRYESYEGRVDALVGNVANYASFYSSHTIMGMNGTVNNFTAYDAEITSQHGNSANINSIYSSNTIMGINGSFNNLTAYDAAITTQHGNSANINSIYSSNTIMGINGSFNNLTAYDAAITSQHGNSANINSIYSSNTIMGINGSFNNLTAYDADIDALQGGSANFESIYASNTFMAPRGTISTFRSYDANVDAIQGIDLNYANVYASNTFMAPRGTINTFRSYDADIDALQGGSANFESMYASNTFMAPNGTINTLTSYDANVESINGDHLNYVDGFFTNLSVSNTFYAANGTIDNLTAYDATITTLKGNSANINSIYSSNTIMGINGSFNNLTAYDANVDALQGNSANFESLYASNTFMAPNGTINTLTSYDATINSLKGTSANYANMYASNTFMAPNGTINTLRSYDANVDAIHGIDLNYANMYASNTFMAPSGTINDFDSYDAMVYTINGHDLNYYNGYFDYLTISSSFTTPHATINELTSYDARIDALKGNSINYQSIYSSNTFMGVNGTINTLRSYDADIDAVQGNSANFESMYSSNTFMSPNGTISTLTSYDATINSLKGTSANYANMYASNTFMAPNGTISTLRSYDANVDAIQGIDLNYANMYASNTFMAPNGTISSLRSYDANVDAIHGIGLNYANMYASNTFMAPNGTINTLTSYDANIDAIQGKDLNYANMYASNTFMGVNGTVNTLTSYDAAIESINGDHLNYVDGFFYNLTASNTFYAIRGTVDYMTAYNLTVSNTFSVNHATINDLTSYDAAIESINGDHLNYVNGIFGNATSTEFAITATNNSNTNYTISGTNTNGGAAYFEGRNQVTPAMTARSYASTVSAAGNNSYAVYAYAQNNTDLGSSELIGVNAIADYVAASGSNNANGLSIGVKGSAIIPTGAGTSLASTQSFGVFGVNNNAAAYGNYAGIRAGVVGLVDASAFSTALFSGAASAGIIAKNTHFGTNDYSILAEGKMVVYIPAATASSAMVITHAGTSGNGLNINMGTTSTDGAIVAALNNTTNTTTALTLTNMSNTRGRVASFVQSGTGAAGNGAISGGSDRDAYDFTTGVFTQNVGFAAGDPYEATEAPYTDQLGAALYVYNSSDDPSATALKIPSGRVVLGYVDEGTGAYAPSVIVDDGGSDYLSVEHLGAYSIIALNAASASFDGNLSLPGDGRTFTSDYKPAIGQIITIVNFTGAAVNYPNSATGVTYMISDNGSQQFVYTTKGWVGF